MNKQNISPIQVTKTRNFTGLVEANHLSNAYMAEPTKVGSALAFAFGYKEDNAISLLTNGIGNTLFVDSREYEWDLHFQNKRSIPISVTSTLSQAGIGGSIFEMTLTEKEFTSTDNLLADDGQTYVRVMSEPYQDGNGWVYRCQITSPNPNAFVKADLLKIGARWSKEWSTVGEYSEKGGGHSYSTPIKLRNQLSTLRKDYPVTREATKQVMVIDMYDPNDSTKKTRLWTKLSEWTAIANWYREIDSHAIYSTYNKDQDGIVKMKDGDERPVFHGAGIREQISQSNKAYYTVLTYEILDEFLLDLSFAARKAGGHHNFVALTGMMGMREFDRAIQGYVKGNNLTVTDKGTFIDGNGDQLELTGYFSKVKFMNGISLTVKEFPPYDDDNRNRTLHPISLKPIESYRFTILNFGTTAKGEANIRKVAMKDSEMAMWHVCGSTDPYGGVAKDAKVMRSSGKDGYEVFFLTQQGVMIKDPTSCGELIMRMC